MSNTIRTRAMLNGDVAKIMALINHPMSLKIVNGKTIPLNFIEQVKAEINGKQVFLADWSAAISKNPFLAFKVKGVKAGDSVKLSWNDNKGKSGSTEFKIS